MPSFEVMPGAQLVQRRMPFKESLYAIRDGVVPTCDFSCKGNAIIEGCHSAQAISNR